MSFKADKIEVFLDGIDKRQKALYTDRNGNFTQLPIYTSDDPLVTGKVKIKLGKKKIKHQGVFVQLIGEAKTFHAMDKSEVFLLHSREVEFPGKLKGENTYEFRFNNFEAKCETYHGSAGSIRYYVRAIIAKEMRSLVSKEEEFAIQLPILGMGLNPGFEIQLRIADYLMISVELNRLNFHINECIIGKITVEQIKLVIKRIQISLIKREIINPTSAITCTKENIITRIELSNKSPKKGDLIPFKINLSSLSLSPTLLLENSKVLVKYVMILSFVDGEDRSLFKPIEINTWRKKDKETFAVN